MVEHTIQWARDEFELYFVQQIQDFNSFISNKEKFNKDLRGSNQREKINRMEAVYKLSSMLKLSTEDKLREFAHSARRIFEKNFTVNIRNLLNNFPADYADDKGVKFWTAPKMCPSIIK